MLLQLIPPLGVAVELFLSLMVHDLALRFSSHLRQTCHRNHSPATMRHDVFLFVLLKGLCQQGVQSWGSASVEAKC